MGKFNRSNSIASHALVWPVEALAVFMQQVLDDVNPSAPAIRQMLKTDRYVHFLRETLERRAEPGQLLFRHLVS